MTVRRVAVQCMAVPHVAIHLDARAMPTLNDGVGVGATEAKAIDTNTTRGMLLDSWPRHRFGRNAQILVIWSDLRIEIFKVKVRRNLAVLNC